MVNRLLSVFLFIVLVALTSEAGEDTMQGTMNERVRTLQVYPERDPAGPPVIGLATSDRIVVSFDVLAEQRDYLRYELVHCNANWQPSGLVDSEFLNGFNRGDITDHEFSQLTTTHYVNYRLTIPNAEVAPLVSGNYLLRIFPEDSPDDIWAQCRFMVSEEVASLDVDITSRTDRDYNRAHQQLSVVVDTERADVDDPFNDLTVMIQQNGRYDNEVALRQPLRMQGRHSSVYEHQAPLIFEAGNEYRRFETVSVNYPGMGIERIEYHEPYYNFTLFTDGPRSSETYTYDQTQHGRFTIREYNSAQSDIEADYVVVHFSLDIPEMPDKMIFIDGDMVQRRFGPESLMLFNRATGRYERAILLKQGAYNYQYLTVPEGANRGYTSTIEGDNYQTVNEYTIKVYARRPTDRYDRLIAVTRVSTE